MLNGLKDEDRKMSEERDIVEKIQFIRRDRFNRHPQMTDNFIIRIYGNEITKSPKEVADTLKHMYKKDTCVDIDYDDNMRCIEIYIADTTPALSIYTLSNIEGIMESRKRDKQ